MKIPIEIIVSILGFVFTVLTIIVGFLIKILNANTDAIKNINLTLVKIETSTKYEEKECTAVHDYISKKITEHSGKIEAHSLVITEHELKIKDLQK